MKNNWLRHGLIRVRRALLPRAIVSSSAALVTAGLVSCAGDVSPASGGVPPGSLGGQPAKPGTGVPEAANSLALIKPTPLRRLTRAEYNNTVRDLLGTELRPAEDFPADDIANGFDNQGQLQAVSPLHIELFQTAAAQLVDELFARPASSPERQAVLSCDPATGLECARQILANFAQRAYRRPVAAAEVDQLLGFVGIAQAQGEGVEQGVRLGLETILVSPHFLFRVEKETGEPLRALDGFELSTRLSYLLWGSTPDDELLLAAEAGTLSEPALLASQIDRMLASPKIGGFVENFAGQWLVTRRLAEHQVDAELFPDFDEGLRAAMAQESRQFFLTLLTEGHPVQDLLLADFTFADARLAEHYGIEGASGEAWARLSLDGTNRRGLLGQGAVLMVTSYPTRTSPVLRGKWVLETLLCSAPPPPPPNVPALEEEEAVQAGTLREILAQHRSSPVCNACHQIMDEIGLGMEQFDAVGRFRATDPSGMPIDAHGSLPDGQGFNGLAELSTVIGQDPRLNTCVTEKLLTYALGRGLDGADDGLWRDTIAAQAVQQGASLRAFIEVLATSDLFTKRATQTTL